VRVLLLSPRADEASVLEAVRSGAAGYLLKDASIAELEQAVRTLARSEVYFSPAVSHLLVAAARRPHVPTEADQLTPRQRQVLERLARGETTKQIARELEVSVKTVETHRADIMRRLGMKNMVQLVRYALRTGLVQPEE
jgi:DNA-binding NarL/FixJ family response regulator